MLSKSRFWNKDLKYCDTNKGKPTYTEIMKTRLSAVYRIILDYQPRSLNITMSFQCLKASDVCLSNLKITKFWKQIKCYESFLRTSSRSDHLLCTLLTVNSMTSLPKQDDTCTFESILNKKQYSYCSTIVT